MQRDLVVSFLSSVPPTVANMFADRPLQLVSPVSQAGGNGYPGGRPGYQQWLSQFRGMGGDLIPGMFRAAGGQPGDSIGRVCVMGFSNGCIGVDELLGAADSAKIDTVLAIDGIHGAFTNVGGQLALHAPSYKRYLNHGAHVVRQDPDADRDAPVMVITHSAIEPRDFPSTTATANYIWDAVWSRAPSDVLTLRCGYPCVPVMHAESLAAVGWPEPQKVCSSQCFSWDRLSDGWVDRRFAGNFAVLGWADRQAGKLVTRDPAGTADHIFQGRVVLREMLKEFVVKRWNDACGVVVATAGFGQDQVIRCKPGQGVNYDESDAGKVDYFPDIPEAAPVPSGCPAPRPGYIIVGGDNPCATLPVSTVAYEELGGWDWKDALAFGGAVAGGYALSRWALRRQER